MVLMVDVRRVKLPGVGVLHTFVTEDGGKVGVITHRSGNSDLITFADAEDTENARKVSLRLDEDEAHTLAELLGGTRITESLSGLDQIPGLSIDWFHVDYDDHIAGQPLGNMTARGLPGVTVVAVVRGDTYHFEIVANESAAGLASVQLEFGIPIGNGILTCDTDAQAAARMDAKGYEATMAALELANLLDAIDER